MSNTTPAFHVIPETGVLPHEQSVLCWCGPEIVTFKALQNIVVRHHPYDDHLNPIPEGEVAVDTEDGGEDEGE